MTWLDTNGSGLVPDPASVWEARIAEIKVHAKNITGVSPVIHGIDAEGRFSNKGQGTYDFIAPYLPPLKALGLDIIPIIYLTGGVGGLARVITPEGTKAFIAAAVAKAVEMDYDGYNLDNEARGGPDPSSWKYLLGYAKPWMEFMNTFADAMHAKNKTLSVDLAGCCGWVDTNSTGPYGPAGHCQGAFASYEFVATTCPMYAASRLDMVYGMGTYSDSIWNSTSPYGPDLLKTMANWTSKAVGLDKYGYGFKGGWHLPADASSEATTRETMDYLRDKIGVRHGAHWLNEPRTQQEWDAWGYFLHSDADEASQNVYV